MNALLKTPHSELIIVAHFGVILTQVQRALALNPRAALGHKIDNFAVTHVSYNIPADVGIINHLP